MGKRKRDKEAHAGQEDSNFNDESMVDSVDVQGEKKKQIKKKNEIAGKSVGKKGGLIVQSGGKKCFSWTSAQEIMVLKELVKLAKMDTSKPLDNSSINWEQLAVAVGERLDQNVTRTQVYEKTRRLKERYIKNMENLSCGMLSFKNKDDEKMLKLSDKVWGACGSPDLHSNEMNSNLPSAGLHGILLDDSGVEKTEKEHRLQDFGSGHLHPNKPEQQLDNEVNVFHEDGSANTYHEQGLTNAGNGSNKQKKPEQGSTNAGNGSNEQKKADQKVASHLSNHRSEEDIKRTIDTFYTEHQALLEDVQKSCMTVLEVMEAKFLSVVSNTVRGIGSPWMGIGGAHIPSADIMLQDPVSWDYMTDNGLSSTGANQSAAFKNLARQWQQQRLEELNLTSLKLQLMLDECKREKERLEKP